MESSKMRKCREYKRYPWKESMRRRLILLTEGLHLHVFVIATALCDELVVSARLADCTILDEISVGSGGQRQFLLKGKARKVHSHAVSVLNG